MVFCNKENCIYRSKRKSSYRANNKPLYKCLCKHIIIDKFCDGGSDMYVPTENSCMCLDFVERIEPYE